MPTGDSKKSFFSKPENITDLIIKGGIVGAGVYYWGEIVPFLVMAAKNTMYLAGLLAILGALLVLVMDNTLRNTIRAAYGLATRWLTGLVVNMDPIGILKDYVKRMHERRALMFEQMGKVKAEERKLRDTVDALKKDMQFKAKLASKAQEQGQTREASLNANKMGRAKNNIETLMPLLTKLEKLGGFLNVMYENLGFFIEDTEDEVKNREITFDAMKAGSNAIRSAAKVLNGTPDERAMFEMATSAIVDDVANRIGYMDTFINESSKFINNVNLENGVAEDDGFKLLEQYQQGNMDWLFTSVKDGAAAAKPMPVLSGGTVDITSIQRSAVQAPNSHSNLFD